MSSRHLVDPDLLPLLEASPTIDITAEILPAVRASRAALLDTLPPLPQSVRVEEIMVPGPPGAPQVRVKVYSPEAGDTSRPAILHLHGGGYIMGSPEMMAPQCAAWAQHLGAVVVAPAYRLAPETCFPGNVEDGYAALGWLHREAGVRNIDTSRIAVAGESAGGGLAAALALLVRDRAEFRFCHQQLIFPMLDDRTAVRKDLSSVFGEFIWTPASNQFGWSSLLGRAPGGPDVSPYAAAARATRLGGLPPAFIATGALDLFTEENLDYARRLMAEGVPVEMHVYPGAPHAFMWAEGARVTQDYSRTAMAAMARGIGAIRHPAG